MAEPTVMADVEELGRFKELPIVDEPVSLANLKAVRNDPHAVEVTGVGT